MSLISLFRYGDPTQVLVTVLSRVFVIFCCMPVHETAHGWMADKMGDHTAKNLGRLSLNPFKHLDLLGTIMIFLFGIGYAKPVPVNARNFKNPKKGMALTALAGPCANIVMSFICVCLYYLVNIILIQFNITVSVLSLIAALFSYAAIVNISLAVFNLLPIPPLDGSKLIGYIIPDKYYYKYLNYERYMMIALLLLLFTGLLDTPITVLSNFLLRAVSFVPELIFNLITG